MNILIGLLALVTISAFAQKNLLCDEYKYAIQDLEYQIGMNEKIPGLYQEELNEMSKLYKESPTLLSCVSILDAFDTVTYKCPKIRLVNFLLDNGADASVRSDYDLDTLFYGIRFYGLIFGKVDYDFMSRKSCVNDVVNPVEKVFYQNVLKRLQDLGLNPERESKYGVSAKKEAIKAKLGWPLDFL